MRRVLQSQKYVRKSVKSLNFPERKGGGWKSKSALLYSSFVETFKREKERAQQRERKNSKTEYACQFGFVWDGMFQDSWTRDTLWTNRMMLVKLAGCHYCPEWNEITVLFHACFSETIKKRHFGIFSPVVIYIIFTKSHLLRALGFSQVAPDF